MSFENERDARVILARDKHFTMRPKPLERWLWDQRLPPAVERVYWVHWEAGQRQGDWCSELSLREVARECGLVPSTITRAYQVLKALGLIRREEPGRDPNNPFRQEVAVTEVLVPRELVAALGRYPNRAASRTTADVVAPVPAASMAVTTAATAPPMNRELHKVAFEKLSTAERSEYHKATLNHATSMAFDPGTRLGPNERGQILQMLVRLAASRPKPVEPGATAARAPSAPARRKLTPLLTARVRSAILAVAPSAQSEDLFRQVLWSIEQGALSKYHPSLALNIAVKKIREGGWTRPHRLPSTWFVRARPETCGAA